VDGHYLWPGPSDRFVADVLVPDGAWLVLLCPKSMPVSWWFSKGPPRGVGLIHARFFDDQRLRSIVQAVVGSDTRAIYVGDIDPVGIAQYLVARRMLGAVGGGPLLYGGVNDPWLLAMQASMGGSVSRVLIRLPRAERQLLRRLEDAVNLDTLVGPSCAQLLRGGHKVELEAVLNPALHGAPYRQWVFRHLRALARSVTRHESNRHRRAAER
jgi:hypothetical protein